MFFPSLYKDPPEFYSWPQSCVDARWGSPSKIKSWTWRGGDRLAGWVSGAGDSWSWGCGFKSYSGYRDYLKINLNKWINQPIHVYFTGKIITFFTNSKTYLFMLTQDVSKIPINLKTPSRISLMTSGGIRSERISERDSGLMFPTASLASLTRG